MKAKKLHSKWKIQKLFFIPTIANNGDQVVVLSFLTLNDRSGWAVKCFTVVKNGQSFIEKTLPRPFSYHISIREAAPQEKAQK